MMGIGGISYTVILSTLYTTGMKTAKWIGARVLAVYLLILNGGLAGGSVIWGTMSIIFGIPITLSLSSFALAATTIAVGKRYKTTSIDDLDFTPAGSDYWSIPHQRSANRPKSDGQALITIEHRIDPKITDEFVQYMQELGHILKSKGLAYWGLFQDPADLSHYI